MTTPSLHGIRVIRNDLLEPNTIVCSPDVYQSLTDACEQQEDLLHPSTPQYVPYWVRTHDGVRPYHMPQWRNKLPDQGTPDVTRNEPTV